MGRSYQNQKAIRSLWFETDPDVATQADFEGIEISSAICAPFSSPFEDYGVVQVVNKAGGGRFTEDDADVIEIMSMLVAQAISTRAARSSAVLRFASYRVPKSVMSLSFWLGGGVLFSARSTHPLTKYKERRRHSLCSTRAGEAPAPMKRHPQRRRFRLR